MFVEKKWWYRGYQCSVVQTDLGHRCGYVAVPKDTPLKGIDAEYIDIQVHGGITLDDKIERSMGARCSEVGMMLGGMRLIGFDCGHCCDAPDIVSAERRGMDTLCMGKLSGMHRGNSVRSHAYCESECRSMVDQIIEVGENVL